MGRAVRLFTNRKRVALGGPGGLIALLLTSLILVACGGDSTPIPPPATPSFQQKFQQDTSAELFYSMNFPAGWTRTNRDPNTVVFTKPDDPNFSIGIVSKQISGLGPSDQSLLAAETNAVKTASPNTREDPAGGGTLPLLDTTTSINRLSFNKNNTDLIEYLGQVNNVQAAQAYLLFGITTAKDSDTFRSTYYDCFKSFISSAPQVARGVSGVADPTVIAANNGGKIRPDNPETKGQYLRLVAWQSPPLNVANKQPILTGTFPLEYDWRIRPFPTAAQPALYLASPIVDRNSNQAVMQIGIYKDAFKSTSPSVDEWKGFYSPILSLVAGQELQAYGGSILPVDVNQVGTLYRAPFTARDPKGGVRSRGFILFGRNGTNGLVGVLSISPNSAVKQDLVDGLDRDFQTIISSIQVKY